MKPFQRVSICSCLFESIVAIIINTNDDLTDQSEFIYLRRHRSSGVCDVSCFLAFYCLTAVHLCFIERALSGLTNRLSLKPAPQGEQEECDNEEKIQSPISIKYIDRALRTQKQVFILEKSSGIFLNEGHTWPPHRSHNCSDARMG